MAAEPLAAWVDGRLVPPGEATVSVWDHGLTVGDGVFETMQVVRDEAFALGRHLARLRRSAAGLGLAVPLDDAALRGAVRATLDAAAEVGTPGRLRLTVTGGAGPLGSGRGGGRPTVVVAAAPAEGWPASCDLVTVPWRRNEHSAVAGLKTTSYAENVVALAHARERGGDEAVFANTAGWLCEGTGTNVFLVRDGQLLTPPLSSGCLAGITRELVLEVVEVREADATLDDLRRAPEAFVTSSTRDVQPVARVDGQALATCPGPRTVEAAAALADLMAGDLDP